MPEDREPVLREFRRDPRTQDQVEPGIPLLADCCAQVLVCRDTAGEFHAVGCERIDAGVAQECVAVFDAINGIAQFGTLEHRSDKLSCLIADCIETESEPVPLDERKFRLVPPARFAVAIHAADRIDIGITRRKQALHVELGRGVQIPLRSRARARVHAEAFDMRIGCSEAAQCRRVDSQYVAPGEKMPNAFEHRGPTSCDGNVRRRPPIKWGRTELFTRSHQSTHPCTTSSPVSGRGASRRRHAATER